MRREIDELLGIESPPHADNLVAAPQDQVDFRLEQVHRLRAGVTPAWLASAFGLPLTTVRSRLGACPVLRGSGRAPVYDLKVAAQYLVDPVLSVKEYLRTIKPEELPENHRESYWAMMLKKQTWLRKAGNLWPTEAVLEVLGETFKTIKNETLLWTDTVNEAKELDEVQRNVVQQLVDNLLKNIHDQLIAKAKKGSTRSQIAEADDE